MLDGRLLPLVSNQHAIRAYCYDDHRPTQTTFWPDLPSRHADSALHPASASAQLDLDHSSPSRVPLETDKGGDSMVKARQSHLEVDLMLALLEITTRTLPAKTIAPVTGGDRCDVVQPMLASRELAREETTQGEIGSTRLDSRPCESPWHPGPDVRHD